MRRRLGGKTLGDVTMARVETIRNIAIGAGVYYLSMWVVPWLSLGWAFLTEGISYGGVFGAVVLLPLVSNLPAAVIAMGVGALVSSLVSSQHPKRWALLPALLFAVAESFSHHWAVQPGVADRAGQLLGAAFLAIACVAGGHVIARRRASERPPRR